MNLSAPFIARPVATTLLTMGLRLPGAAFLKLPVSPLPQVDFQRSWCRRSTGAAGYRGISLAEPLERRLGQIAHVTEMTSANTLGQTRIILNSTSAATSTAPRDVRRRSAGADLPTNLPVRPIAR
jgi:multidrug efflux pump